MKITRCKGYEWNAVCERSLVLSSDAYLFIAFYLSKTFRFFAVRRLSVLMLSAGGISGYNLNPYIIYIHMLYLPVYKVGFLHRLRWKPFNLNTPLLPIVWGLCFRFLLEFFVCLFAFPLDCCLICFQFSSIPFGLAWCFVTRCKHSNLPGGMGLWLSTTDRAPSSLFEEILCWRGELPTGGMPKLGGFSKR